MTVRRFLFGSIVAFTLGQVIPNEPLRYALLKLVLAVIIGAWISNVTVEFHWRGWRNVWKIRLIKK